MNKNRRSKISINKGRSPNFKIWRNNFNKVRNNNRFSKRMIVKQTNKRKKRVIPKNHRKSRLKKQPKSN